LEISRTRQINKREKIVFGVETFFFWLKFFDFLASLVNLPEILKHSKKLSELEILSKKFYFIVKIR